MNIKIREKRLMALTTAVFIIICLLIYYKEDRKNKIEPKRATFVKSFIMEDNDSYG